MTPHAIVHVTDCYSPRVGGIELQVAELARRQRAAGHDVRIVTATPTNGTADPAGDGHPGVHRISSALPYALPVHPLPGRRLDRLLRESPPDVVHVHLGAVSPFAWAGIVRAQRLGLPTVVSVHSMWGGITRGLYQTFDRVGRWSSAPLVVTAVSHAAAALVRRVGTRVELSVVPNGIAPEEWRVPVPAEPPATREVHVLAVGRFAPRKEPLTLLRVLSSARNRLAPSVRLRATVVGDGPAWGWVDRQVRRGGMAGWLVLPGRLGHPAVRDLMSSAQVFLAPAALESFGLAALEARVAGLPVVARTGNGISEFVCSGREGLLGDGPRDLVDALVRLSREDELRRRIAEHNRRTTPTHCAWPAVLAQFDRCYARAREITS